MIYRRTEVTKCCLYHCIRIKNIAFQPLNQNTVTTLMFCDNLQTMYGLCKTGGCMQIELCDLFYSKKYSSLIFIKRCIKGVHVSSILRCIMDIRFCLAFREEISFVPCRDNNSNEMESVRKIRLKYSYTTILIMTLLSSKCEHQHFGPEIVKNRKILLVHVIFARSV